MTLRLEVHAPPVWGAAVGQRLAARVAGSPGIRLCLPTGDTPEPAYAGFAAAGGSLGDAEVFLLDEFALPDGDPARCDQMIRRSLFDLLPSPPGVFHRLDILAPDLAAECARYEGVIAAGGLDLTLLGLGANGHLGLNEPGSPATAPTRPVALHEATIRHASRYGAATPPMEGATMGLGTILGSREIWLLVTGSHKAEILDRVLHDPVTTDVPGSLLRDHPNATILADEAALTGGV